MKKLVLIGILAVLGVIASIKLPPVYRHLMVKRLLKIAESADAGHQYENAYRYYRLALLRGPDDLNLLHSYAGFLDEINRPEALGIRLRIIQLDPLDTEARLDGAGTALRQRKITTARRLLSNPTPGMQASPRYYDLLGWMQFSSFDLRDADAVWASALDKNPDNKIYAANLSTVRLSSTNESVRNEAFARLKQLALGEKPPLSALASVMTFAAQSPAEPAGLDPLLDRFQELVPPTNSFFTNYLDALRRWRPDRFKQEFAAYTRFAATSPETAMLARNWMVTSELYGEFLAFQNSLPKPSRENLQSMLLEAQVLFSLKRMDELDALLRQPAWQASLPLKMAWQERIRRATQPSTGQDATAKNWNTILDAAGKNDVLLVNLTRMAFTWQWWNEYTLSLWAMADRLPSYSPDSLETLFQFYLHAGDSRSFRKVIKRQLALQPDNPDLQNNFAFLSFLLDSETGEAAKTSATLCALHPDAPVYLSTRAFGFLKAGQPGRGLELFKRLDVKQLRGTATGVCYGYLLAATGDRLALDYLKDAEKWVSFPEEMEMIANARKQVASTAP
ncbi:MAG: hypothetical protein WCD79_03935 [Chthoniobacteraceae bacterium]